MGRKDIKNILERISSGTSDQDEEQIAKYWLHYFHRKDVPDLSEAELNEESDIIYHSLINEYGSRPVKVRRFWSRVAVAAAVAAVVFGAWFYSSKYQDASIKNGSIVSVNDIRPGKNTATLTLANGKVINLSDAKSGLVVGSEILKYNDGTNINDPSLSRNISSSRGGERNMMLTASTPRGGTYQVILPDGSKVWLNAASSLKFPSTFRRLKNRTVELNGEAYFEIFKNKKQPFVVKSRSQEVVVLGTHFNINSYADEHNVKTTLLEGSVRITPLNPLTKAAKGDVILEPNQQAILTNNGLKVSQANAEEVLAWKNGYFVFINEDVRSIMRKISRWYNIDVAYEGQIENKAIWGSVSKFSNVSEVLNMLSATKTIKFKIEGKKIIVLPGRQ